MQCRAKAKQTQEQCKNHAHPGYAVCWYHGARAGRKPTHGYRTTQNDAARAETTRLKREAKELLKLAKCK